MTSHHAHSNGIGDAGENTLPSLDGSTAVACVTEAGNNVEDLTTPLENLG